MTRPVQFQMCHRQAPARASLTHQTLIAAVGSNVELSDNDNNNNKPGVKRTYLGRPPYDLVLAVPISSLAASDGQPAKSNLRQRQTCRRQPVVVQPARDLRAWRSTLQLNSARSIEP